MTAALALAQDWRREKLWTSACQWPATQTSVRQAAIFDSKGWITRKPILRINDRAYDALDAAIDASHYIAALEDNWDGEESPGYTEDAWLRATEFLREAHKLLTNIYSCRLSIPRIMPGPNGSIDLLWRSAHSRLLINFPVDIDTPAGFYGDDFGKSRIKGTFEQLSEKSAVVAQLIEYCQ